MLPWEWHIGDGHYCSVGNFLTPYRGIPGKMLSDDQHMTNTIISHYRARIEHINGFVKQHAIFSTKYRGGIQILAKCIDITIHTTNVHLNAFPRYAPYGPWSHI